eukprot:m.56884 g.56884  ORF g.56884 m.56884 type:complete len:110 (+) comp12067_c0_seq3:1265-1594(+)
MRRDEAAFPLFGEDSYKKRLIDLLFGVVTIVCVLATIVIAFTRGATEVINIVFGIIIILISAPQLVLVFWFRNGDLGPKFRYLIVYMMFAIMLLCACAIVYFYKKPSCS